MRTPSLHAATLLFLLTACPPSAVALVWYAFAMMQAAAFSCSELEPTPYLRVVELAGKLHSRPDHCMQQRALGRHQTSSRYRSH